MKEIVKNLLQIEEEAKNLINYATTESEKRKNDAINKIEQLKREKLGNCYKEIETIFQTAEKYASEQVKKIEKSTEWEITNLKERFESKQGHFINLTLNKIKPKI